MGGGDGEADRRALAERAVDAQLTAVRDHEVRPEPTQAFDPLHRPEAVPPLGDACLLDAGGEVVGRPDAETLGQWVLHDLTTGQTDIVKTGNSAPGPQNDWWMALGGDGLNATWVSSIDSHVDGDDNEVDGKCSFVRVTMSGRWSRIAPGGACVVSTCTV